MSEEIDRLAEELHDKWRRNEFPGKGYPNNTFGVIKATLAECERQKAEMDGRLKRLSTERDNKANSLAHANDALAEYDTKLEEAEKAIEYEIRLADKEVELLKLRSGEDPKTAAILRPFGSNIWRMSERLKKALQSLRQSTQTEEK